MKLIVGHRACGILFRYISKIGGKWLLPANVCPVVPFTFIEAKIPFEFVDIDRETYCISEEEVLKKIRSDKTIIGVLFVHTYGCVYDVERFIHKIRDIRTIKLIDDKCLCRPDLVSQDTLADVVLYSTGYAKYVDLGKGGYAWLQNSEDLCREDTIYESDTIEDYYKKLQKTEKLYSPENVPNHWIDTYLEKSEDKIEEYFKIIQKELPIIDEHKKSINNIYNNLLSANNLGEYMNVWRYNLFVDKKEDILSTIFAAGLYASSHYYPSSKLFTKKRYPNAEWLYEHIINLFNDKYISINQAKELSKQLINNINKKI